MDWFLYANGLRHERVKYYQYHQTKNKQSAFENIFDYKYHTLSSRIIRKRILGIVTIDLQI